MQKRPNVINRIKTGLEKLRPANISTLVRADTTKANKSGKCCNGYQNRNQIYEKSRVVFLVDAFI